MRKLTDITDSYKGSTAPPTYQLFSTRKKTEHWDTAHRFGWTTLCLSHVEQKKNTPENHIRYSPNWTMKDTEQAGRKTKFYQNETIWLGHIISQDGIRSNKEKTDAIKKLEPSTNTKTLKYFFGAIKYFASFIPNFSKELDKMRQLLKKGTKWKRRTDPNWGFNKTKQELTNTTLFGTLQWKQENIVITDACKTGLRVALWQKQGNGE